MHPLSEEAQPAESDVEALNEFFRLREEWLKKPISDDPEEWEYVADLNLWQSWKNSAAFSRDAGKTYFKLEDNVDPQKSTIYTSVHKDGT